MLNIEQVNVYYDESIVLRQVDLTVPSGQVVALMGRNGVGKTTLLKTVMGLLRPREGRVVFEGEEITKKTPDQRARAGIGYVPQGREIFPQLTVEENLLLGLEAKRDKRRDIPEDIYTMFPVLQQMLSRKGGDLSGGQQQQLAIARALVSRPKLLILDEPTEGIQPSIILDIAQAIQTIRAQGDVSILLVEQYLDFILDLTDYYYVMEKGEIMAQGLTAEMKEENVREYLTF